MYLLKSIVKTALRLCLLILLTDGLMAQSNVQMEWQKTFQSGDPDWDEAQVLDRDPAGNIFVLGEIQKSTGAILLQKYDASGVLLWENQLAGKIAQDVATDSSGNVYVLVNPTELAGFGFRPDVIKFDPAGIQLWLGSYIPTIAPLCYGMELDVNDDQEITVGGMLHTGFDVVGNVVFRYDAAGNLLWEHNYPYAGSNNWEYLTIEVDDQGNTYAMTSADYANGGAGSAGVLFYKVDDAGNLDWDTTLPNLAYGFNIALNASQEPALLIYNGIGPVNFTAMGFDANGQIVGDVTVIEFQGFWSTPYTMGYGPDDFLYLAYKTTNGSLSDNKLLKIDHGFNVVWDRPFAGDYTNPRRTIQSLDFRSSGNLVLGGMTNYSFNTSSYLDDLLVLELDTAGSLVQRLDWDGGAMGKELFSEMVLDDQGGVLIAGQSMPSLPNRDMALIRLDLNGGSNWVRRYNSNTVGPCKFKKMVVDGTGNVYLAGEINPPGAVKRVVLVKYSITGNKIWEESYLMDPDRTLGIGDMQVDSTGNLYLGVHSTDSLVEELYILKIEPNANVAWNYTQSSNGGDLFECQELSLDPQGNLYVGANQYWTSNLKAWFYMKLDAGGTSLWDSTLVGPGSIYETGLAGIKPYGGDVWIGGVLEDRVKALKLNGNGQVIAQILHADENGGSPCAMELNAQGGPLLLARRGEPNGGNLNAKKWEFFQYQPDGTLDWSYLFHPNANEQARPDALAIDNAGRIFGGGWTGRITGINQVEVETTLARLSANGTEDWEYKAGIGSYVAVGVEEILPMQGGDAVYCGPDGVFEGNVEAKWIGPAGNVEWSYHYSDAVYTASRGIQIAESPGGFFLGLGNQLNGEDAQMVITKFSVPTDRPDPEQEMGAVIFPQPATHTLTVRWEGLRSSPDAAVRLVDLQGKFIFQGTVKKVAGSAIDIAINLPDVGAGGYLLQMENQKGLRLNEKILLR